MNDIKSNHFCSASEVIAKWYRQVSAEKKAAFFTAFLFGFVVHIIAITGWLFNWDTDVVESSGWIILQGKWASDLVYALDSGNYCIAMSRITTLVAIGIAAALLADIFAVKSTFWAGLIGACMVSFPSIMCAFAYGAVGFWGMTLVVFSLWIAWNCRGGIGFFCSAGILAFALGVYQPHIGFAAAGMVFLCMLELLEEDSTAKKVFFHAVRYLAILGIGILLYYIILKLVLHGRPLGDYQNISGIDHITFSGIWSGIQYAYSSFFSMFLFDGYGTGYSYIVFAYRSLFFLTVIGLVLLLIKCRVYKKPLKLALMLVLAALYPLAVHAVAVLSQGASSHWIMMYSFVMLPVTFIVIAHRCELILKESDFSTKGLLTFLRSKSNLLYQWCCCLCCFLLLYGWSITANEGYLRLRIAYEGAYQQVTDMVDDIYENEAYQNGCRTIAFVRGSVNSAPPVLAQYDAYTGIANKYYIYAYDGIVIKFIDNLLSITFPYADAAQMQSIQELPELAEMPCYPEQGYIQEINGVLVVKM